MVSKVIENVDGKTTVMCTKQSNNQAAVSFGKCKTFYRPKRSHVKHFIATHFYYEENGSIATLTKKERIRYIDCLNEMVIKDHEPKPANAIASPTQSSN